MSRAAGLEGQLGPGPYCTYKHTFIEGIEEVDDEHGKKEEIKLAPQPDLDGVLFCNGLQPVALIIVINV